MNVFMIPIILTAAFLLVGCEGSDDTTTDPSVPEPIVPQPVEPSEPLSVDFADGVLSYTARVMTPTPCHEVRVEQSILESDPIEVEIRVSFVEPGPDRVCAQVIDEKTISGTITLGEEPGRVTLVTPFETHEASV
jgi:hypothetical protein